MSDCVFCDIVAGRAPAKVVEEWNDMIAFVPLCPGCGYSLGGPIGDTPISGWDNPQWTVEGDDEHLTLMPSLGCGGWRSGNCIGHWWAKDGKLVLA